MKKKILAIALCLTMVLTTGSFAFATDTATNQELEAAAKSSLDEMQQQINTEDVIDSSVKKDTTENIEVEEESGITCSEEQYGNEFNNPYVNPVNYTDVGPLLNFKNSKTKFKSRGAQSDQRITHDDIETSKGIVYDPATGKYTLKLEAYLKGAPTTKERVPNDMILVLDQSSSMLACFQCGSQMDRRIYVDHNKTYWVESYDPNATERIQVYYCPGNQAKENMNCGHSQGGWWDKPHYANDTGSSTTERGHRYVASVANAKDNYYRLENGSSEYYVYTRVFYTSKTGNSTENTYKADFNFENGVPTNVVYRKSGTSAVEMVYCKNHAAWHDKGTECTDEKCTWYVPTSTYDEVTLGTTRFFRSVSRVNCVNKGHISRYQALLSALQTFKNNIYEYSEENDVNNRIGVATFANTYYTNLMSIPSSSSEAETTVSPKRYNASSDTITAEEYGSALIDVSEANGRAMVDDAISKVMDHGGGTNTHHGFKIAENIYNNSERLLPGETKRNRIVVMFTDGQPQSSADRYGGGDTSLLNANELKKMGVTVYTIGIFSGADATDKACVERDTVVTEQKDKPYGYIEEASSSNKLMQLMSSNYAAKDTAPSMANNYKASELKDGYYLSTDNPEDLEDIFDKIAENINAGSSLEYLTGETVVRDVMSVEFQVDSDREISVHTEAYVKDGEGGYKFVDDNNTAIDSQIKIQKNGQSADKTVEVTGFNFTENYVAVDDNYGTPTPRGRKLVIEIPIEPDENQNNNSTEVPTNDLEKSGIFRGNTCHENFPLPRMDIPTNVTIEKQTVGSNVPADQTFNFNIEYSQFDGYKTNDSLQNNNYLEAKVVTNNPYNKNLSGVSATDTLSDKVVFAKDREADSTGSVVVVGTEMTITETVSSDYKVEYSLDGGETWKDATVNQAGTKATIKENVTYGMNVLVRNTLQRADITINKAISGGVNPEQNFVFNVSGNGVNVDAVIPAKDFVDGNGSVKIKDLEVGSYKVTEIEDWSWRYENVDEAGIERTVELTPSGAAVSFTNAKNYIYWLSGDDYCSNIFGTQVTTVDELQELLN